MKTQADSPIQSLFVNDKDAAKLLGVSRRTVWRMESDGQLKAVRIRGCTRFVRAEIMRWLPADILTEAT